MRAARIVDLDALLAGKRALDARAAADPTVGQGSGRCAYGRPRGSRERTRICAPIHAMPLPRNSF